MGKADRLTLMGTMNSMSNNGAELPSGKLSHNRWENHHFLWENPLLMVIFNSYVKLPEGTLNYGILILSCYFVGEVRFSTTNIVLGPPIERNP